MANPALFTYLAKDANAELQMGAVSGLGDIQSAKATEAIVKGLPDFTKANRELAIGALLRTRDRTRALLDSVAAGSTKSEWFVEIHRRALLMHADEAIRKRAQEMLKKE
jgi:hypothetical protein